MFIYEEKEKVYFIDLEHSFKVGKKSIITTSNYIQNKNFKSFEVKKIDEIKFAELIIEIISGIKFNKSIDLFLEEFLIFLKNHNLPFRYFILVDEILRTNLNFNKIKKNFNKMINKQSNLNFKNNKIESCFLKNDFTILKKDDLKDKYLNLIKKINNTNNKKELEKFILKINELIKNLKIMYKNKSWVFDGKFYIPYLKARTTRIYYSIILLINKKIINNNHKLYLFLKNNIHNLFFLSCNEYNFIFGLPGIIFTLHKYKKAIKSNYKIIDEIIHKQIHLILFNFFYLSKEEKNIIKELLIIMNKI